MAYPAQGERAAPAPGGDRSTLHGLVNIAPEATRLVRGGHRHIDKSKLETETRAILSHAFMVTLSLIKIVLVCEVVTSDDMHQFLFYGNTNTSAASRCPSASAGRYLFTPSCG